jgi:hypothetical protein
LIDRNPLLLKALKESMDKSMQKYNKTKEAASQIGITTAREMKMKVHPIFEGEMNEGDQWMVDFQQAVTNYKPKSSCLEIGILKTKDETMIDSFTDALRKQRKSQ